MPERTVIRWEEPPPSRTGKSGGRPGGTESSMYDPIAAQLRERRGDWALIEETEGVKEKGLASKIRRGGLVCFTPRGDFDAVTRYRGGVVRTYARFLGDGEGDDA